LALDTSPGKVQTHEAKAYLSNQLDISWLGLDEVNIDA
jgi:hypothetical protein